MKDAIIFSKSVNFFSARELWNENCGALLEKLLVGEIVLIIGRLEVVGIV